MDMVDAEKTSTTFVKSTGANGIHVHIDADEEYSYEQQRHIIHRVDRRLVLICGLAYCVSLIDRANVSMAAVAGMTQELSLDEGYRYVRPFHITFDSVV
ncbi:hypothetical protein BBP40_005742 [Aspergillus hancockii]|nr:hypothetical protein BBP40_005742 [Aspergillus hancockii]